MGQAERPDLTDLPAFNDFQEKAEKYLAGEADVIHSLESMASMEDVLLRMFAQFHDNLAFQEETDAIKQAVPLVYEGFGKLRTTLPELREALEAEDERRARRYLTRARKLVNQIFNGFFVLRQEEAERPLHSESAPVNELVRVGEAFLTGKLPLERFRKRLDQFIEFHQNLTATVETMQPTPAERAVLAEVGDTLREAMERQGEAIGHLESYFEHPDVHELRTGLSLACQAGDQLLAITHQLTGASQTTGEASKSCLRCSAMNPISARYCEQCNAMFPAVDHLEDAPTSHLDMREQGEPAPQATADNLLILVETAEQVKRKTLSDAEFIKTLDWMQEKLEGVRKKLAEMEPARPETPPDQLAILEEAREHMAVGADDFEAGLARMRAYLQRRDPNVLDRGLEMTLQAADVMMRVDELFRSLTSGPRRD